MDFYEVKIMRRATNQSWTIKTYCESPDEAVQLARLTFGETTHDVTCASLTLDPNIPNARGKPSAIAVQTELF